MNKIYPVIIVLLVASGFVMNEKLPVQQQESFSTGETLKYKIHYGLITAAEGTVEISDEVQRINNRPCYQATVSGKTIGSFDFFLRIRDTWRSYIDTISILPQRFHRDIEEGKYRKREKVTFDHYKNTAFVESKQTETYKVPDNIQDIVSGFYYMRTLDLEKYRVGDVIKIKGFFDKEVFDFNVTYRGRETVETKAGNFRAYKLVPKMPENKLFSGEDAITVYLSDDRNKIPVLIKAEMLVGALKVDLYKYKGLKYKVNKVNNM